jgi:hypothetical protein
MVPGAPKPEPHRLRYAWTLVQGSRVIAKLGEIDQATAITFEVTVRRR